MSGDSSIVRCTQRTERGSWQREMQALLRTMNWGGTLPLMLGFMI